MIKGLLGIIDKMRIEIYPSDKYMKAESPTEKAESPIKTIFVQLNPEKYSIKQNVAFWPDQAMKSAGAKLMYNKTEPVQVNFEFLFDSSGVVPPGKIIERNGKVPPLDDIGDAIKPAVLNPFGEVETVDKHVEDFKTLLIGFNSDTHETAFLRLLWGTFQLDCRLISMDIEYMLFRKDGRPIRAKVKCGFKGTESYTLSEAKLNKRSPDLTHERVMKMNDSLVLLSESIYQNNTFYIDVAKNNKLLSFRKVKLGLKIEFPPIK